MRATRVFRHFLVIIALTVFVAPLYAQTGYPPSAPPAPVTGQPSPEQYYQPQPQPQYQTQPEPGPQPQPQYQTQPPPQPVPRSRTIPPGAGATPGAMNQPSPQGQGNLEYAFRPNLTNPEYGQCLKMEQHFQGLYNQYTQLYNQYTVTPTSHPNYAQLANHLNQLRVQLENAWQTFAAQCIYFPSRP